MKFNRLAFTVFSAAFILLTGGILWKLNPDYFSQAAVYQPEHGLVKDVWIGPQLKPGDLNRLKARGMTAIVDLRPDGEAPDQPTSQSMAQAARDLGMDFAYVPVPHGDIPDDAVKALADVLNTIPRPVVLYCRSGSRAARAWGLAEASRPNGLKEDEIRRVVAGAGQSVDDLAAAIAARIAARPAPDGKKIP